MTVLMNVASHTSVRDFQSALQENNKNDVCTNSNNNYDSYNTIVLNISTACIKVQQQINKVVTDHRLCPRFATAGNVYDNYVKLHEYI